ncbi:hypothetical protein [Rhizobium sp. G21]|uniref:hypothetical protein n=1 Tax=Rhizobium sp. G21 TaxID=2758439 RepID=UPI001603D885|nr:hypothetical protein [Rhizobium sp. G21]MBB1247464.1 hypothetical protein [Rhizobium sp. G21]
MTGAEFRAWRERMNLNRSQAADALGLGRNQPQLYEEEKRPIQRYIALACAALEAGLSVESEPAE